MSRLKEHLPLILTIAVGLLASLPLLAHPTAISLNDDWTQILAFHAYLGDQLSQFGSLPQRSHMLGGGFPILGHPEYPILSPLTLPSLLLGPALGIKLAVISVSLLAALGMWRLGAVLGLGPWSTLWATAALLFGGWFPAILASGNYPQIYALWLPLLAALLFEGRLFLGALAGATMLTDGHLNTICTFLILGLWAALRGARDLRRFAGLMALTAGLAAFKLLPTLALLRLEDRAIPYTGGAIELARSHWDAFLGHAAPVDAFALGVLPWLLAPFALIAWRRSWRIAALLLVSILLYLGPQAPLDLFGALHRLPVLRSIDAPAKYFVFYIGFFALLLGAQTLDRLPARPRPWGLGFAGLALIPLIISAWQILPRIFTEPDLPQVHRPFVQVDTDWFVGGRWSGPPDQRPDLYAYYRRGVGILRWEDNFQLPAPSIPGWRISPSGILTPNPAYRGEAWSEPPGAAVDPAPPSANTLGATVSDLAGPTKLVFNQRFDPGWTCDGGAGPPSDTRGLLSVPIDRPATITCEYASRPFLIGVWVSLLTLLGYAGWQLSQRRRA